MLSQIIFVAFLAVALKFGGGQLNFRKSHRESFYRAPGQVEARGVSRQYQQQHREDSKFRYRVHDGLGNMHYHAQHRSKSGVVRGCYGYTDVKGLYRIVEYIADEGGFRVKIHSQEPGIHRKNPAHVKMNVHSPLTGIGYSYVHPCVDIGTTPGPKTTGKTSKSTKGEGGTTESWEKSISTTVSGQLSTTPRTIPFNYTFPPGEGTTEIPFDPTTKDYKRTTPPDEDSHKVRTDCDCTVSGPGVKQAVSLGLELSEVVPKQGALSMEKVPGSMKVIRGNDILAGKCDCYFVDKRKGQGFTNGDVRGFKQTG